MIIAVWKPKFKIINKKRIIIYYEKIELDELKTGWKIVYKCDECGYISNSTSSSMMKNDKWNNLNHQICRKCRSIKSERLKDGIITYEKFKSKLKANNYKVITTKREFENQLYPSQAKMGIICNNGHFLYVTWNNFVNKNKRCRICYEENKYSNAIKYKEGFKLYKYLVNYYTNINYNKYKEKINPGNLNRGYNKYHLDHKFSICEGFKNNILPVVIGSSCNLRIITGTQNIQKKDKCSITKNSLFKEYNE